MADTAKDEMVDNLDDNEWESCSDADSDDSAGDEEASNNSMPTDIPRQVNKKNKRIYDTLSRLYKSISSNKLTASSKTGEKSVKKHKDKTVIKEESIEKNGKPAEHTEEQVVNNQTVDQSTDIVVEPADDTTGTTTQEEEHAAKQGETNDIETEVPAAIIAKPRNIMALAYEELVLEATEDLNLSTDAEHAAVATGNEDSDTLNDSKNGSNSAMTTNGSTTSNTNNIYKKSASDQQNSNGRSNGTTNKTDQSLTAKTINRIDNIGYSSWKNAISFCCLISDCGFETEELSKLLSHIEDHENIWTGYCYVCDKQVIEDELPLILELKHMNDIHLNVSKDDNDIGVHGKKPIIKFRRLSGDKLSTVNEQPTPPSVPPTISMAKSWSQSSAIKTNSNSLLKSNPLGIEIFSVNSIASPPPPTNGGFLKISNVVGGCAREPPLTNIHIDVIPPSSDGSSSTANDNSTANTDRMIISNVVSLNAATLGPISASITETVDNTGISKFNLKPWTTKTPTLKSSQMCGVMLNEVSLFAPYKCMAVECSFSSSNAYAMLHHLRNHEKEIGQQNSSTMDTSSWLECPYCEEIADSCTWLVKHIQEEHTNSIFQCPYCFYRTCAAHNVIIHLKLYHPKDKIHVYVCNGKAKSLQTDLNHIWKSRATNVRAINCGDGKSNYFHYCL